MTDWPSAIQHGAQHLLGTLAQLADVHAWDTEYRETQQQQVRSFDPAQATPRLSWLERAHRHACHSAWQSLTALREEWHLQQMQKLWRSETVAPLHQWPRALQQAQRTQAPCVLHEHTHAADAHRWTTVTTRGTLTEEDGLPQARTQAPLFGGEGPGKYGTHRTQVVWHLEKDATAWDDTSLWVQRNNFARSECFADVSLRHNAGRLIYGKRQRVSFTPSQFHREGSSQIRGHARGPLVPLPTVLDHDGRPAYMFLPTRDDEFVSWDADAGQLYLERPGVAADTIRLVEIRSTHVRYGQWHGNVQPLNFTVASAPPVHKDALPQALRDIFHEAQAQGDISLPHPLTRGEQLRFAAWRLGHLLHPDPRPASLDIVTRFGMTGVRQLFNEIDAADSPHMTEGKIHADCELANALLYLGARAFGYNVRRVNGLAEPQSKSTELEDGSTQYFKEVRTPGHAVVEHLWWQQIDDALAPQAQYDIVDATPSIPPLHAEIAHKIHRNHHGDPLVDLEALYTKLRAGSSQTLHHIAHVIRAGTVQPLSTQYREQIERNVTTPGFIFSFVSSGSHPHPQVLIHARDPRAPQEQGQLLFRAYDPMSHFSLLTGEQLFTLQDLGRHLKHATHLKHAQIFDPTLRDALHNAQEALPYLTPKFAFDVEDTLTIAHQVHLRCGEHSWDTDPATVPCGMRKLTMEFDGVVHDHVMVNYQQYKRPFDHAVTSIDGTPHSLEALLDMHFVHVRVRNDVLRYSRQRNYTAAWNAEHRVLLLDDGVPGTVYDQHGQLHRLLPIVRTTQRMQLGIARLDVVNTLDSQPVAHRAGILSSTHDASARFLITVASTLPTLDPDSEAYRTLVYDTCATLASAPPQFLTRDHFYTEPARMREAASLDFILREAQRLGITIELHEELPLPSDSAVQTQCTSNNYDIPHACISTSHAIASTAELESMLQIYVSSHREQFQHASQHTPAQQRAHYESLTERILPPTRESPY